MNRSLAILGAVLLLAGCQQQGIEGKWEANFTLDGKQIPIHVDMQHGGHWTGHVTTDATEIDGFNVPSMTAIATGTWDLTGENLTFVTSDVDLTDVKGPAALAKKPIEDHIKDSLAQYQVSKAKFPDPMSIEITTPSGDTLTFHRE